MSGDDNLPALADADAEIATIRENLRNGGDLTPAMNARWLELEDARVTHRKASEPSPASVTTPLERGVLAELHPDDRRDLKRSIASLPAGARDAIGKAVSVADQFGESGATVLTLAAYYLYQAGQLDAAVAWIDEMPSRQFRAIQRALGG